MRLPLASLDTYAFCDPAGKRKPGVSLKKIRARSAIVVVGADTLERIFVLAAWADKCSPTTLLDKMFELHEIWHPKRFGIEANAMQELYADMVAVEARRRGSTIALVPISQPSGLDKFWRIRGNVQPVYGAGRLFASPQAHELRREIGEFPTGQTVDILDALSSAIALVPRRAPKAIDRDERDALAAYLRKAGADPRAIEDRLARFDATHAARAGR